MRTSYRTVSAAGGLLLAAALIALALPVEDASVDRFARWLEPTNQYYDAFRIEISIAILGLFLLWAGPALHRLHPDPAALPRWRWRPHVVFGLIAFPAFWIGHHGLLGKPDWIWAEDGPMEYLTVALLVVSGGLALAAWRRDRARLDKAERVLLWTFALSLFFLAAEEVSWGQRILDIETPPALAEKNVQGEINLHNLTVGWNEVFRMLIACLLSALIWLNEDDRIPGLRGRLQTLKPPRGWFFWLPVLLIPAHLYDELFEQVVSFAILSYALLLVRRPRHS
ncbi:MAG: hypothetical protein RIB45_14295 [Marivibrio sp.]|uniref:hypothetical protein n=1 Tax=Marivibrio sp. TaxID=2039719 RepID=UPI0032ED9D68